MNFDIQKKYIYISVTLSPSPLFGGHYHATQFAAHLLMTMAHVTAQEAKDYGFEKEIESSYLMQ